MTATYELEMPTVKHPFIDAKRQDEILESKTEDDWIQFFKSLQFIDYREGRQTKSIYYKDKKDYAALQTYKILCNRSFGKAASLSSPNLNHFGSDEFSFESYLEQNARHKA